MQASATAAEGVRRCVHMRVGDNAPQMIGYALKRMKIKDAATGEGVVTVQPLMAGMRGPRVTLLGRDVRLAVLARQASPQELWHKAWWNAEDTGPCAPSGRAWHETLRNGLYRRAILDNSIGVTSYHPKIMFRSRAILDGMVLRPRGFALGGAISLPIANNASSLQYINDMRAPVRRDLARFADTPAIERLYAAWRTTPMSDVHIAITAGLLEEMYAGAGAEIVWRPFASPLWVGADAWRVQRRDADSFLNMQRHGERETTFHARAGYDMPDTRTSFSLAAGRYLAGDYGATLGMTQSFENGWRIDAALTWTNRDEAEGLFRNTRIDPSIRLTMPLWGSKWAESRTRLHQVGRDSGQMLDRPLPLERLTEPFSAREYIRHWPRMF